MDRFLIQKIRSDSKGSFVQQQFLRLWDQTSKAPEWILPEEKRKGTKAWGPGKQKFRSLRFFSKVSFEKVWIFLASFQPVLA